jgi:hypothetical protein
LRMRRNSDLPGQKFDRGRGMVTRFEFVAACPSPKGRGSKGPGQVVTPGHDGPPSVTGVSAIVDISF